MAWLLPWEVRPAELSWAPPAGTPPAGRACRVGGGTPGSLGAGGHAGRGWAVGRGLTRPSPVHLLSPSPACPDLTLVPSSPRPPGGGGGGGCCCHPPGRLSRLPSPPRDWPGRGQAATFSSPPPPPPCWPFAHRTGGPIAPQPPVGPAPALTRVGVGTGRVGPSVGGSGKRLFVGEAPVKGTWSSES